MSKVLKNPNFYKKVGGAIKRNPAKTAAAAGFLHSGPLGAAVGAGVVKAYQHRKQIKGAVKRTFRKLKNTIKRR